MATATTVNEAHSEALANRKKKIAELKARLKSLAVAQRHNKEAYKAFQRHETDILKCLDGDGNMVRGWNKEHSEQLLTVLHIVYNRLRNRSPHTKDDDSYLSGCRPELWHVPAMYKLQATKYGLRGCLSCPRRTEVTTPKLECDAMDCHENIPWFEFEGGEL